MQLSDARQIVLVLKGQWHGHYGMARCPAHDDHTPSLSIAQGRIGPLFKCHAGCTFAAITRALRARRIQIGRTAADSSAPVRPPGYSISLIEHLWSRGRALAGTLGERYLTARGLGGHHPQLRFAPRCTYGPVRAPIMSGPALLVPMHLDQRLVGLQRIFLDPRDEQHFGRFKPVLCAEPRAAMAIEPAGSALALAESAEDAIAYTRLHGIPAWGLPGIEWLAHTAIPGRIENLIIAFDRGPAARRAFDRHAQRLAAGRRSLLFDPPPPPAKDWNEYLQRAGRALAA